VFHPVAVGDGGGLTLHLTRDARFRSALPPDTTFAAAFDGLADALAVESTLALETRPLADALSATGAGCDLLRVHLPGAEARVLLGAVAPLAGIAVVHVRVPLVPLYREEPPFDGIDALLAAHGFLMHRFVPGILVPIRTPPVTEHDARMPGPGQPLWREAIYVADYVDPGSRPARVWHRLAVAAHALYAAPDLAHRALANADALEGTGLSKRYADAVLGAPVPPSVAPTRSGWFARLFDR
jgi:hypothetical protein